MGVGWVGGWGEATREAEGEGGAGARGRQGGVGGNKSEVVCVRAARNTRGGVAEWDVREGEESGVMVAE